jgi:glycosyltransferase involved in cell wall biosynthesis
VNTTDQRNGISIVIPTIGRDSLTKLLASIHLDDTLKLHEILIVANSEICENLKQSYNEYKCIKLVTQEKSNISKSRNKGISNSNFNTISPIDDDDLWVNGRAKLFQDKLQINQNAVVFGSAQFNGTSRYKQNQKGSNQRVDFEDFVKIFNPKILSKQNFFLQVGNCAFRKNINLPKFNEELTYLEDQIWILDLLQSGFMVTQIKEITIEYFFSRSRANRRWNIVTEKEIFKRLSKVDLSLARGYIFQRSLKSLALSSNDNLFNKAKVEILIEFDPRGKEKLQILFLSIINISVRVLRKALSNCKNVFKIFLKIRSLR